MKEKRKPSRKVKLVARPSPAALKIMLILLILFSIVALVALRWVHNGIRAETQNLRDEAAAIEFENEELDRKSENMGAFQTILEIAKEELGLVDPNTVIIDPKP